MPDDGSGTWTVCGLLYRRVKDRETRKAERMKRQNIKSISVSEPFGFNLDSVDESGRG